jgi:hypothetical protein
MALILDKTTTGITSMVVVTGLTEEFVATGYTETTPTKTGYIETTYQGDTYTETTVTTGLTHLNYVDNFGGVNNNPYLIIRQLELERITSYAKIKVFIYKDKAARNNNKGPLTGEEYYISDKTVFDTYFSMDVLETSNVFSKAYEYITTICVGWKSDE